MGEDHSKNVVQGRFKAVAFVKRFSHFRQNEELKQWHKLTDTDNENETITVEKCYYRDFRVSPWASTEEADGIPAYEKTKAWWHVLVTRLAFILIFEHFIFFVQTLIEWCIPTVPWRSEVRREREEHLQREEFLKSEAEKDDNA